jgi:hypothetical protein
MATFRVYSGIACRAILPHATTATTLPIDRERALLVGRAFVPAVAGAVLVAVAATISSTRRQCAHVSMLMNLDDPAAALRVRDRLPPIARLDDVLANSDEDARCRQAVACSRPTTCRPSRPRA